MICAERYHVSLQKLLMEHESVQHGGVMSFRPLVAAGIGVSDEDQNFCRGH
jgi:hypothetical protein